MSITEFNQSTVRDIFIVLRARRKIEEREWERTAWQTALLMNVHLERRHQVTASKLLGRGSTSRNQHENIKEELKERHRRKKALEIWGHADGHALHEE